MGKMNFLKRRSKTKTYICVNEKPVSHQLLPTERKSSDTSLDDEKVALFYSDQPGKAKMTPIPTPPPSPPKAKGIARPQSQPTTPLTSSFHAELPLSAAPPSPPRSPWRKGKVADESVLDRCSRLSQESTPLSPQSPIQAMSAKLDSSMNGGNTSNIEYSVVKKSPRRKARKSSQTDQPPLSPPHTPPPLPPPLREQEQLKDKKVVTPKEDTDDQWETCLRCSSRLNFRTDESSPSATTPTNNEPIYHVLERPLLCDACLKKDRHISVRDLPCPSPPLPPRDFGPSNKAHPVYERVDNFTKSLENGREEPRRAPPISLNLRTNSSTDYESIPSLETSNLDGGNSRISLGQMKLDTSTSNQSSHDYESIDVQNIDDSPLSPPYIPDSATRNKFLKIDSQGYASVLYPHEVDDSWEFDCLNQDKYRTESQSSAGSGVTVQNVEQAWKHQLEKGYASLTVRNQLPLPPPLPPAFSRTSSAPPIAVAPPCPPSSASPLPPEPQDYEVPMHVMGAPPPPPVALRRSSLMKQPAVCTTPGSEPRHLNNVQEKEKRKSMRRGESKDSTHPELPTGPHSLRPERFTMRSRVMTAPAIALQSLAEQIS